jgi:predicted DNA-binding transcriptional regulator AlpA
MDSLLNQKQAAHVLGVSARTLERHRVAGTGPRWARLGKLVRYRQSDLDAWVERSLRTSTSESVDPRGLACSTSERPSSAGKASAARSWLKGHGP